MSSLQHSLVSIIIVNFNGHHHLEQCLPALLQTSGISFETIVVDNGSTDDSIDWLQRNYPQIRVLELGSNLGFGAANQRGVEVAHGEYVAFLNNDTLVEPDWLTALYIPFQTEKNIGATCSTLRLLKYPELLNASGGGMSRLGFGFDFEFLFPYKKAPVAYKEVLFPTAAAMLIRKDDFQQYGGFDRSFFMYHEDVDLGWRLWLLGKRVLVSSDSVVYHYWGGTTRKVEGLRWREWMGMRHNLRTLIKHFGIFYLLKAIKGLIGNWHRNRNYAQMLHVLGWNLLHLPDTLAQRWQIQRHRVISDRELLDRGLISPFRFVPPHPEFPHILSETSIDNWIESPTLLVGQYSSLGRMGYGWYGMEEHPDGRTRWTAGEATCCLKVAPSATGMLEMEICLYPKSGVERRVTLSCNGEEVIHYSVCTEEEWETVILPVWANPQGLLTIQISSPIWIPHYAHGGDDYRQLGCRIRSLRFQSDRKDDLCHYESISTIVPTFNRCEILFETLDALAHQTWRNFEIIVIDDGSTDCTWQELKIWQEKHGKAINLKIARQENLKQGFARNHALQYATGDLVIFLGDDIIPDPTFLESHISKHNQMGEPCAVVGFTDWDRDRMQVTPFLEFINFDGPQFGYRYMKNGDDIPFTCFYTSNISLPRQVLSKEPFSSAFSSYGWEDTELGYRLSVQGLRIVYNQDARAKHFHPMSMVSFLKRQQLVGETIGTILNLHPELERSERMPSQKTPTRVALLWGVFPLILPIIAYLDRLKVRMPTEIYRLLAAWSFYKGKHG